MWQIPEVMYSNGGDNMSNYNSSEDYVYAIYGQRQTILGLVEGYPNMTLLCKEAFLKLQGLKYLDKEDIKKCAFINVELKAKWAGELHNEFLYLMKLESFAKMAFKREALEALSKESEASWD